MYEQFFGLADAPFRLTPDPRYLFLSRKHADALAHLKLGLSESSGFVCITGDVGTGKTTLLRAFLTGPIPDTSTAYVFNPGLSPLARPETAADVAHRLAVASQGHAGPIFTRPALRLIHRLSGGVPRLINMIAHRAMVAAFADDSRIVRRRSVRRAYDEIAVVPLPARRRASRVAALATVGAAACLAVIAIGAARLSPPPEPAALPAAEPTSASATPAAEPPARNAAPVPEPPSAPPGAASAPPH